MYCELGMYPREYGTAKEDVIVFPGTRSVCLSVGETSNSLARREIVVF